MFFFSFSKVCLTDVSFSSVRWSRRVRSTKDTCVSVEKWVKYMSILLYSWRGAVDPAAKTAEVRRHDTFKESNSRLVHYTTATTELSFLYSSLFFYVCFSLSYEAYDMSRSTREILQRSKKYCHRPNCPVGRLIYTRVSSESLLVLKFLSCFVFSKKYVAF